jgi:hypothetical protein
VNSIELHGFKLDLPNDHWLLQILDQLWDYSENIGRMAAAVERKYIWATDLLTPGVRQLLYACTRTCLFSVSNGPSSITNFLKLMCANSKGTWSCGTQVKMFLVKGTDIAISVELFSAGEIIREFRRARSAHRAKPSR